MANSRFVKMVDTENRDPKYVIRTEELNDLFKQVREAKPLNQMENFKLMVELKNSDAERQSEIKNRIVRGNMRFLWSCIVSTGCVSDRLADMFGDAMYGLCEAMEKWVPKLKEGVDKKFSESDPKTWFDLEYTDCFAFSTYAVQIVKKRVLESIAEGGVVRCNAYMARVQKEVARYRERYFAEHGAYPSMGMEMDEMEARFGCRLPEEYWKNLKDVSIDDSGCGDDEYDAEDGQVAKEMNRKTSVLNDGPAVLDVEDMRMIVERMMDGLSDGEAAVVRMVWGIGCKEHGMLETAALLGIGSEDVERMKRTALSKMRKAAKKTKSVDNPVDNFIFG